MRSKCSVKGCRKTATHVAPHVCCEYHWYSWWYESLSSRVIREDAEYGETDKKTKKLLLKLAKEKERKAR